MLLNVWLISQERAAARYEISAVLRGTEAPPEAQAVLMRGTHSERRGIMVVQGLPELPGDEQYQLWLIRDGKRQNGGVFGISAERETVHEFTSPRPLGSFERFGVTVEPHGGSPGPTGTIYAMLHVDSGEMGSYEFPDGDPPVKKDGSVVVVPFSVAVSM